MVKSKKNISHKRRTKFGIKAASSIEVPDKRALTKLSLNFRTFRYGTLGGRARRAQPAPRTQTDRLFFFFQTYRTQLFYILFDT